MYGRAAYFGLPPFSHDDYPRSRKFYWKKEFKNRKQNKKLGWTNLRDWEPSGIEKPVLVSANGEIWEDVRCIEPGRRYWRSGKEAYHWRYRSGTPLEDIPLPVEYDPYSKKKCKRDKNKTHKQRDEATTKYESREDARLDHIEKKLDRLLQLLEMQDV